MLSFIEEYHARSILDANKISEKKLCSLYLLRETTSFPTLFTLSGTNFTQSMGGQSQVACVRIKEQSQNGKRKEFLTCCSDEDVRFIIYVFKNHTGLKLLSRILTTIWLTFRKRSSEYLTKTVKKEFL